VTSKASKATSAFDADENAAAERSAGPPSATLTPARSSVTVRDRR
jgi:hypothetical protein